MQSTPEIKLAGVTFIYLGQKMKMYTFELYCRPTGGISKVGQSCAMGL